MDAGREKLAESFGTDWSSGKAKAADLFQDLWKQLGECHQNALQELEAKVSKLKKERCLDAQRLDVFYNRNQQLKEQNKNLQDAIALLEERLRTGGCDRCTILEENLKNSREQNLQLIEKLKNERKLLVDENRNLRAELQKVKMSRFESQEGSPPEQEEGIIPDSPVLPSSLPVVNKLKKPKNTDKMKCVRYAEVPLPYCNNSLFNDLNKDPDGATRTPGRAEVLVPNTCEMDSSQISKDVTEDEEEAIAETVGLELIENYQMKPRKAASQQSSSSTLWKSDVRLKPYCSSPDSTSEKSPSLLPHIKRFAEGGTICRAKRVKEENDPEVGECSQQGIRKGDDNQKEGKRIQPEQITQTTISVSNQSIKKEPVDSKAALEHNESTSQMPSACCTSPAFKKPNRKAKLDADGKRRTPLQELNASKGQREADAARKHTVEPTWSIDPALALSMYESEWKKEEEMGEQQHFEEMADTDCTWVSHSLLQRQGENGRDKGDGVSGLGEKANDSLDIIFDTTAYGEYKSCNSSCLGQSQPCDDDDNDDDDEEEEDKEDPPEDAACQSKARHPAFAHVAVIRKKDERRKLKGTTCKECEIYYAHLPEEEKQKKLSACSRHRFLYIPPCTPENFWEVGFPSTQTCIERGYIKEDKNPQARLRRRQPFNALFSPKRSREEN